MIPRFILLTSFLGNFLGINVDAKDQEGRTALWRAARYGRLAVVEPLVSYGKVIMFKI